MPVKLSVSCGYLNATDISAFEDEVAHLMFIFWGVIIPIISTVGVLGNILTMIVLFRRAMQLTFTIFLRTLAVTDTAIIIVAVLGLSVLAITLRNPEMWLFTDVIYPHIYIPTNYLLMTLQMINVWATVAVSGERYVAICHPLKSAKIYTKKNAFISLTVIVVVSLFYNIPRCFAITVVKCMPNSKITHSCFELLTTDFGRGLLYTEFYFFWMYLIFIYIIPLAFLSVMNILLIAKHMRMRRTRTPLGVGEKRQSNMTLISVLIFLVFIFCQTPGVCAQFTFWKPDVLIKWTYVSNTLFVLNSSVNFFIYIAVGSEFRKTLLQTFHVSVNKTGNNFTMTGFMPLDDTDERSQMTPFT